MEGPEYLAMGASSSCAWCLACAACGLCGLSPSLAYAAAGAALSSCS